MKDKSYWTNRVSDWETLLLLETDHKKLRIYGKALRVAKRELHAMRRKFSTMANSSY